ncbi:sugar kinase [Aliihoeflea sp. PC F10.4]
MTAKLFLSIGEPMVELGRSETADLWRMGFAGDVLNTLWYARACLPRDGWRTALLTRLGSDSFSARMLEFLTANGFETDFVSIDDKRSVGLYAIDLSPDGERRFSYWRSQSAARGLADDAEMLGDAAQQADLVYYSGISLAILPPTGRANLIETARTARERGQMVVFDPNIRPALWEDAQTMRDWMQKAMATAAIALPSFDDEATVWGDTTVEACAERWQKAGAGEVVVKNGGGDIVVASASGAATKIEVQRIRPVDTTGAGDAFNAGYLVSRLAGRDLRDAVLSGHNLAAQVIGQRGALLPMADIAMARD